MKTHGAASFILGLAALGAGFYFYPPGGWSDWAAIALFFYAGSQIVGHWGWWRDLSP
ncbi:MAG: hypothetical protein ABEJ46_03435 [Gemmatimonadota bacterium]